MSLNEEFKKAIRNRRPWTASRRFDGLHFAISGPGRSGKTTNAFDYIEMLRNEKIVTGEAIQMNFGSLLMEREAENALQRACNGALIVDEVSQPNSPAIADCIRKAVVTGSCIVILTGSNEGVNAFLRNDIPLMDRMRRVTTERSFTHAEMEEYERLKDEEKHRWDPDIALKKPVTAMKVLRLNKWEPT